MAQSVKPLPHKHDNVRPYVSTHGKKAGTEGLALNPRPGYVGIVSPAASVGSRFSETLSQRTKSREREKDV